METTEWEEIKSKSTPVVELMEKYPPIKRLVYNDPKDEVIHLAEMDLKPELLGCNSDIWLYGEIADNVDLDQPLTYEIKQINTGEKPGKFLMLIKNE